MSPSVLVAERHLLSWAYPAAARAHSSVAYPGLLNRARAKSCSMEKISWQWAKRNCAEFVAGKCQWCFNTSACSPIAVLSTTLPTALKCRELIKQRDLLAPMMCSKLLGFRDGPTTTPSNFRAACNNELVWLARLRSIHRFCCSTSHFPHWIHLYEKKCKTNSYDYRKRCSEQSFSSRTTLRKHCD